MMMKMITQGYVIDCTPIRALERGFLLVYCQDRLVIASIVDAVTCREVKSMDVLPFIQKYI